MILLPCCKECAQYSISREQYSIPTCAYRVLACGGAWELAAESWELYYSRMAYYSCDWVLSILLKHEK